MVDNNSVIRDLGNGLILRSAMAADAEALAEFNGHVHSDFGWDEPDEGVAVWTRDLLLEPHPTFKPEDFLVVEDTAAGMIVSSTNLIAQTWSYGSIEIPVGRPELVGTHPDYRNRGLVRAQFEVLHRWSEERGHKMQGITGIPYYYRQFGYETALDMHGGYAGPLFSVPALKDDATESYTVRPATSKDIPFLQTVDAYAAKRHLIHCMRDAAMWRYEMAGRSPESGMETQVNIIADAENTPVGYLVHPNVRWGNTLALWVYELDPGVSWWEVTPCVMRYLKTVGATYGTYYKSEADTPFERLIFLLGREHPCYPIVTQEWLPQYRKPYSWYIRVADLPGFLKLIAPVLGERLARSIMAGYSGELRLNFYRSGLHLVFEKGRLAEAQSWEPDNTESSTEFPPLTFLQLVFGYHSLAELMAAFPDCGGRLEARLLLDALFPKQASYVWPVA